MTRNGRRKSIQSYVKCSGHIEFLPHSRYIYRQRNWHHKNMLSLFKICITSQPNAKSIYYSSMNCTERNFKDETELDVNKNYVYFVCSFRNYLNMFFMFPNIHFQEKYLTFISLSYNYLLLMIFFIYRQIVSFYLFLH